WRSVRARARGCGARRAQRQGLAASRPRGIRSGAGCRNADSGRRGDPAATRRSCALMERLWIRRGTVIDGTGAPPLRADILVEDGRIAELTPYPSPTRRGEQDLNRSMSRDDALPR